MNEVQRVVDPMRCVHKGDPRINRGTHSAINVQRSDGLESYRVHYARYYHTTWKYGLENDGVSALQVVIPLVDLGRGIVRPV